MSFTELLGSTLVGKEGDIATETALSGKKSVALYFSAHWCPPCKGFTPQLAEWYTKDLKNKGMEVVFVSSDRDDKAFKDYYGEQPWLALPFDDRAKKEALSKKFKVQGIPSLVILGPDGSLITTDGRSAVQNDPTGQDMPWIPPKFSDVFATATLKSPDGTEKKGGDLLGKSVIGLYFSAHWCPPCKAFTPKFAEWYSADLKAKGLEVVFVSSDKDAGAFKEYSGEQPWLALDFAQRDIKKKLDSIFKVEGIPSLVIIDKDGTVINKDGRSAVSGDPTGAEFPWYPKPVANLKDGPGNINEIPTVIALCETSDEATKKAVEAAMVPLAKKIIAEAKAKGEEDPALAFMIATARGGIGEKIRQMFSLPEAGETAALPPKLMLCDIPDEGGFYEGPEGDITESVLQNFVDDYLAKSLVRKQLQ